MSDFPGTEHYREKANEVWLTEYGRDVMALCDHIEDLEKQNEQAWERAALEARRVLKNGSKALKLERQVGERDKEIERLRGALRTISRAYEFRPRYRIGRALWRAGIGQNWGLVLDKCVEIARDALEVSTRTESSEEKP